jgi:hypothetical protein
MTHDYIRNSLPPKAGGTTTLFAALNILDSTVIGQCMQCHRHQEFLLFLNRLEREIPAGRLVHVVLDNYGSHSHPKSGPGWRAGSAQYRMPTLLRLSSIAGWRTFTPIPGWAIAYLGSTSSQPVACPA